MNYYRCIIAYDGTEYQGWQSQTNKRGIVNVLEQTFQEAFGYSAKIVGASRTDSGVHANGQVARITTELNVEPEVLRLAWNNRLPLSISILSVEPTVHSFHPMSKVHQKTYTYTIFPQRPMPLYARYGWYVKYRIDMDELAKALQLFVGAHDFRSFSSNTDDKDTIRTIDSITMAYDELRNAYRIEIKGKSFLHHMIRRMVGAAVDVATRSDIDHTAIVQALENPTPRQRLYNAPACGLVLDRIDYE